MDGSSREVSVVFYYFRVKLTYQSTRQCIMEEQERSEQVYEPVFPH